MVCKEDICHWFQCTQSYDRIDLLCKLLHLCSSHELRFIASIVEDQARKDYSTLRESATKANNVTELKKLCPDLFKAADRSTLLVYLSLLNSTNTVCSHALSTLLTRIEGQRLACHLHMKHNSNAEKGHSVGVINSDIAYDVILLYTMAAYHPAFSISQRLQLSDYLQKAESYLVEYFSKPESAEAEQSVESCVQDSHGNTKATYVGRPISPLSQIPHQSQTSAIKKPVHVKNAELKRSQWDAAGHCSGFHIQVTWSSGEMTEIFRTYQQINAFHVELLHLFPKDSGAHRQQRHIPYLTQEKRGQDSLNEEHINKYIKQLSALPEHIVQCDHVTNFFGVNELLSEDPITDYSRQMQKSRQSSECEEVTSLMDPETQYNGNDVGCLAVPTAHAATNVVQQRISYSSVVVSPLPHNSPLPSPLSSPHVSPSQITSTNKQAEPDNSITAWLKNLRLHKYANLSKYSWQQVCTKLSRLNDQDLEREGLTDGARKKFHKELEAQLAKMVGVVSKNGIVHPTRVRQDSSNSTSSTNSLSSVHSSSTPTPSPVPNPNFQISQNNITSPNHCATQYHPQVHLPLAIMTRVGYSHSVANSLDSTNSICSPESDCSGLTSSSSPRSHDGGVPLMPVNGGIHHDSSPPVGQPNCLIDNGQDTEENITSVFNKDLVQSPVHYHSPTNIAEMSPFPKIGAPGDCAPPGGYPCMPEGSQSTNMPLPPHLLPLHLPLPTDNGMPVPVHPVVLHPRTPLSAPQIRSPRLQGNNGNCMGALIPVGPVTAAPAALPSPCPPHNGFPEQNRQGILMAKPNGQAPKINPDVMTVNNIPTDANNKPPMNYSVLPPQPCLMPRVPSLMGPAPGCHIVQRPSNLGIPTTNNGTFNGVRTPGHGNSPTPYDKGTPVHLPPTNIPPPITTSSLDMNVPYHSVATCSVTFTTGTAFTPTAPAPGSNQSGLLSTPPLAPPTGSNSVSVGPSPPGTLVHPTPTQTPTTVTTPVPQPLPPPQHNSLAQSECKCRCNCQLYSGHSPQPQPPQQSQQPPPPIATVPTTLHFNYQQPMGWTQNPLFPAGYPIPGGFIPVSSNGLVNPNINFPQFSPHMPQSPFNNMPPEILFEPRNYALFHAASNQGIPHAFQPQLHYPMMPGYHTGLHHSGNNSKPHKNTMCYNCGQNGHMAFECKAPTMENLTRAQFHLNMQPRNEND